jgi:alpha-tubulin suppressor-like RCC1 family protein
VERWPSLEESSLPKIKCISLGDHFSSASSDKGFMYLWGRSHEGMLSHREGNSDEEDNRPQNHDDLAKKLADLDAKVAAAKAAAEAAAADSTSTPTDSKSEQKLTGSDNVDVECVPAPRLVKGLDVAVRRIAAGANHILVTSSLYSTHSFYSIPMMMSLLLICPNREW